MQFTLTDLWHHMGLFARLIVAAMAVMSVASVLVGSERVLVFRKSRKQSRAFAERLLPHLTKRDLVAAAGVAHSPDNGHLGRVLQAGLKAFQGALGLDPDLGVESVSRALERQAQRELANLKRGQGVLATVSSTAPFVGLLGTVMGIVNSFQLMAASGSGGLGTVSAGIAEALVTTAFGLLVAIPAVMAFNYFQSKIDAAAVDISEASNELLDLAAQQLRMKAYVGAEAA
jgi:biopolymer transport protein ExbB/biopolymer transport protein TolQ